MCVVYLVAHREVEGSGDDFAGGTEGGRGDFRGLFLASLPTADGDFAGSTILVLVLVLAFFHVLVLVLAFSLVLALVLFLAFVCCDHK